MPKKNTDGCSFLLDKPKADLPTMIIFQMYCPDGKVKRSIGRMAVPGEWDFNKQRAAGTSRAARDTNRLIESIVGMLPGLKSECQRANRVISKADVNAALDVILQDVKPDKAPAAPDERDMFTDIETVITGMKDGSILTPGKNKKRYSEATIGNYELRTLPKLREFYKDKNKSAVWGKINIDLYNEFLSWCHTNNLSNNSIGTYIKCWKRAGKIALKKGWHSNNIFEDEDFMTLKEDTPDIYLDEIKLEKIFNTVLANEKHAIARDWAILDSCLGLRISDLRKVTANDFAGEFFQFVNQKTGAHVAIPIHRYAREILKKWGGLPPVMKDHFLRDHIKTVAKLAGLKDKFIYVATIGGQVKKFEYEEWQCVSPHTFRRSFITNLLKLGIPHAQVMKLAGIKRYETLMRYFKQTSIEVAKDVSDHKFFK